MVCFGGHAYKISCRVFGPSVEGERLGTADPYLCGWIGGPRLERAREDAVSAASS
jgi:hypothetical protein